MLLYSQLFFAQRDRLAQRAFENGLPVMGYVSELVRVGLFMSYGRDARSSLRGVLWLGDLGECHESKRAIGSAP